MIRCQNLIKILIIKFLGRRVVNNNKKETGQFAQHKVREVTEKPVDNANNDQAAAVQTVNRLHKDTIEAHSLIFESLVRTFATAVTVTTVLYPVDILQTRLQLGRDKLPANISLASPFLFNYRTLQPLISGFGSAMKASLLRNTIIANREKISSLVDAKQPIDKEPIEPEQELNLNKPGQRTLLKQYSSLVITTGIIGALDTLATQYYANKKVLNVAGLNPLFTPLQKLQLMRQGIGLRGSRNVLNTFACISATSILPNLLNPVISQKMYPTVNNVTSTIIAGFAVSPVVNIADTIYKRKINSLNLEKLTTEPYLGIIHKIYNENGVRPFFRGSLLGGIQSSLVFGTVNGVNWIMSKYVFPKNYEDSTDITQSIGLKI